ncbi:hypothetical protein QBZ16_003132 [Prototheca wickerhamii]|uniref:ABC transporter domain-containing protein n=1 Tax=Prototheca wickerhamii TaxID=3111 RepID=A0AAD9MLB1_PROWI|nr:hypothetical protein QBZ16_003132 [Prototheca wickerhamii]
MAPGLFERLVTANTTFVTCRTSLEAGASLSNASAPAAEAPAAEAAGQGGSSSSPGSCEIGFTLDSSKVPVLCNATGCAMSAGSADVQCADVKCGCEGGACPAGLIGGMVSGVNGAASLRCASSGACSIALNGLPVESIDVQCSAGECLVPTTATLSNTTGSSGSVAHLSVNPFIAAIPIMLLFSLLVCITAYATVNRRFWRPCHGDMAELEALAAGASNGAGPRARVGVLTFQALGVSVPMNPRLVARKQAALRCKVLRRTATSHVLHRHPEDSGLGSLLRAAKQRLGVDTSEDLEVPAALRERGEEDEVDAALRALSPRHGAEEAEAAAHYVAALHLAPGEAGRWTVLGGISGQLRCGGLVGVLGPSGCGKTSLLGSLAGAATELGSAAAVTGSILVDGRPRSRTDVAYVPQSDVLIPSLTVQESLRYSALLRLPASSSPTEISLRIDLALDELGLRHVADSQVGGSGRIRGISGGERRRVTIGMELVTDPAILVLDEPSSGLDSFTALNLMRTLRQVAASGRIVVASLHQPSHDMFFSLDAALLMAHGRLLYQGPPGDAAAWFAARGMPAPPGAALAEHLLAVASDPVSIQTLLHIGDVLNVASQEPSTQSAASLAYASGTVVNPLALAALDTPTSSDGSPESSAGGAASPASESPVTVAAKAGHAASSSPPDSLELSAPPPGAPARPAARAPAPAARRPGFSRQLAVMTWRTGVDILRNPTLLRLHLGIGLLMGLATGAVFWQLDSSNVGVQNRMGGTFFALAFLAFTSITTVDLLILERAVVVREVRGGYYRAAAYLLSKLTLDGVFLRALPALLYYCCFYYMAGFRGGAAYQATYAFCLLTFSCTIGALSMAVTVVSNTAGEASFGMNFIILFSIMFTGFLVNVNSIPTWLRWIHYLSIFFYAFEAMITNEMTGRTFSFQASGYGELTGIVGNTYLETLGFDPSATTRDIGVLVGFYGAFVLLSHTPDEHAASIMSLVAGSALVAGMVYNHLQTRSPAPTLQLSYAGAGFMAPRMQLAEIQLLQSCACTLVERATSEAPAAARMVEPAGAAAAAYAGQKTLDHGRWTRGKVDAVRLAYQRRIQAIWMSCERAVVERKEETPENVRSSEERRPLLNELAQGERTLFARQLSLVPRSVCTGQLVLWLLAGCRRALLALESARSRAREAVLPREAAWPGVARLGSALARPAVAAARASLAGGE